MRVLSLFLVLVLLAGCASDERTSLVVYSPHGKEMLADSERSFEALYPDINVQWIDMGGQDAYDRIRTERAKGITRLEFRCGWRALHDRTLSEDVF